MLYDSQPPDLSPFRSPGALLYDHGTHYTKPDPADQRDTRKLDTVWQYLWMLVFDVGWDRAVYDINRTLYPLNHTTSLSTNSITRIKFGCRGLWWGENSPRLGLPAIGIVELYGSNNTPVSYCNKKVTIKNYIVVKLTKKSPSSLDRPSSISHDRCVSTRYILYTYKLNRQTAL